MERLLSVFEQFYNKFPYYGNLCFIDVETTGLDASARLIEIGAIAVGFDGFNVKFKTFETLINPGMQISSRITEITGITNDDLRDAPGDEVYDKFEAWLTKFNFKYLIAHNADFDEGKIKYNLKRVGKDLQLPPFDCTMKLSRKVNHQTKDDKLKTLAQHFQFENKQAHRALADTEVCAYIFCKMKLGEI